MKAKVIGWKGVVNAMSSDAMKLNLVLWFTRKVNAACHDDQNYLNWLVAVFMADGLKKWEAVNRILDDRKELAYLFL